MWIRRPDALDYGLIGAVTALAYAQLPPSWHAAIATTLTAWSDPAALIGSLVAGQSPAYYVVPTALAVALLLVVLAEGLTGAK